MLDYLVFMSDLAPSPGPSHDGAERRYFAHEADARAFAELQKSKWDFVVIYSRTSHGDLEMLGKYRKGGEYEIVRDAPPNG